MTRRDIMLFSHKCFKMGLDGVETDSLITMARRLNKADTNWCNGDMSEKDHDVKVAMLCAVLGSILKPKGVNFYHQTDPRGLSLYISKDKMSRHSYTNGIPVLEI